MVKRTRTILFLICFALFLLISLVAIFYSLGYRFDFKTKQIVQTGGLFLKVEPKQSRVFINDKLVKKTDFLFGTVLIKDLLPGRYKIKVEKDGFHSWEKSLEIKEKEVTEAKNIVLLPRNLNFKVLREKIKNFWPSPDGKKIIFLNENDDGWQLSSYEIDRALEFNLIKEKDIAETVALIDLEFSSDQQEVFLSAVIKGELSPRAYVIGVGGDLTKTPPILTKATTTEKESLSRFNGIKKGNVSKKINDDLYYLDNSGRLFKNQEGLTEMSFMSFEISPNFRKLALIQDYEIWILFIEPQSSQPQRKANEQIHLTRFSKKIGEIFWYNSDYLIFRVGEEIKITEIDNRDGLNIVNLTDFEETIPGELKIFFGQTDKKLYILNKNNFLVSEKLLP